MNEVIFHSKHENWFNNLNFMKTKQQKQIIKQKTGEYLHTANIVNHNYLKNKHYIILQ